MIPESLYNMSYNGDMDKITTNEEILEALTPVPNFESRDDIKPWIHENLDARGINLVIERSDSSKVVFKCKNLHRKSSASRTTPRTTTTKVINGKQIHRRVKRSIPEDSCPFRLRVSYSMKYKNWSVNIIKDEHNFSLCSNFGIGQPSPIDHASVSAARQYGNQAINQSASAHGLSTKRPYYTSATPSPSSSLTNSPALSTSANTPHEFLDYEPYFKRQKQQYNRFDQSPLYNEIDPLDQIPITWPKEEQTSSLNDDLNYVYAGGSASDILSDPTNEFSTTFSDLPFSNEAMFKSSLSTYTATTSVSGPSSTTSNSIFENAPHAPGSSVNAQSFNAQSLNDDFPKFYQTSINPPSSAGHVGATGSGAQSNNNSLNIKQEEIQDNDPLMYLLSSTNSSYSFEELENLDKAMGIDANDKILMSMFQGM